MREIGFIGAFDKTDMLTRIAKIITGLGQKTIIIDSTINQKAKYIIPVINPTTTYITEFEGFDVAVGFHNMSEMREYLGLAEHEELEYDIALIDIDSSSSFEGFNMGDASTNYFVTSFDVFSLKKGLEILSGINYNIFLKKIIYTQTMSKEEDDYLNFLSKDYPITWDEDKIFFPLEMGDQSVIIEGQRVSKIKFKSLSSNYKDSLLYIVEDILREVNPNEVKRTMKIIEKNQ